MKRIFKFAAIALISILASSMSMAQEQDSKGEHESIRTTIYLSGGMQYMNAKGINEDLKTAGYGYFSDINYIIGVGADVTIYDRWIIGAEWDRVSNVNSTINPTLSMRAEMSGSRTMIRFGYNVVHKNKFNFFPELGFGGNLIKFDTKSALIDSVTNSFSQILVSNNGNMATYTNSFANIGVGIDFTISDSENSQSGCRIGLRAGYQIAFSKSWSNNGNNITGPQVNPNMFYVKLTVGFTTKYNNSATLKYSE